MQSFEDLDAWQEAMNLVAEVYTLTKNFPKEEVFGLTSQLKRASTSIVANIAEGFGRFTYPDKANKYTIARGEVSEVKAHLLIAIRVQMLSQKEAEKALQITETVGRLLSGLIASCKKRA